MKAPNWVYEDPISKKFWKDHAGSLSESGVLTSLNVEVFSTLCRVFADYRATLGSTDPATLRRQKALLEMFVVLCREFHLTPKSAARVKKEESPSTELEDFLAAR